MFGQEGDVWFVSEAALLRTIDAAQTFEIVDSVDSALAVGFGKASGDADYPTIYLSGTVGGEPGLYRSDDEGESWTAIHDDRHRFGWVGHISGDPRIEGRVYLGTGGRGLLFGDPR